MSVSEARVSVSVSKAKVSGARKRVTSAPSVFLLYQSMFNVIYYTSIFMYSTSPDRDGSRLSL